MEVDGDARTDSSPVWLGGHDARTSPSKNWADVAAFAFNTTRGKHVARLKDCDLLRRPRCMHQDGPSLTNSGRKTKHKQRTKRMHAESHAVFWTVRRAADAAAHKNARSGTSRHRLRHLRGGSTKRAEDACSSFCSAGRALSPSLLSRSPSPPSAGPMLFMHGYFSCRRPSGCVGVSELSRRWRARAQTYMWNQAANCVSAMGSVGIGAGHSRRGDRSRWRRKRGA
jgi:hypothetical protein